MPEKQKARNWKGPQTLIAVIAMLTQIMLCNIFAGVDRQRISKNSQPSDPTLLAGTTALPACPNVLPKQNMGAKCITQTRSS